MLSPAIYEISHHLISRLQRKTGLTGRTAALSLLGEWQLWAEIVYSDGNLPIKNGEFTLTPQSL